MKETQIAAARISPPAPSAVDNTHLPDTYREHHEELKKRLADDGFLALLLIDVSEINEVERAYGSSKYEDLMNMVRKVVAEFKGDQLRHDDIVTLNEKAGDVFLIFLAPRKEKEHLLAEDIENIGERVDTELSRRIRQTAFAVLRKRPEVYVGTSLVLQNPLIRGERLVTRAIEEAHHAARLNVQRRHLKNKQVLQRIILEKEITTVFQPIWDLEKRIPHGFEALCRGPSGTELRSPAALFDVARKSDLLFELDHLCRRKALEAAGARAQLSKEYKLFINTLPFSIRDPRFQGKDLIDLFEGIDLAPEQIVLEVTESDAIDNFPLFVNAMKDFMDLRCLVAIDDMGAGYSGLDKIVHLRPNYVKLDMGLIRDIHTSFVKQQLVQTFKTLADKIDAKLIAEGIERVEELDVVRRIGVQFIQGNLLAKPSQAFQTTSSFQL